MNDSSCTGPADAVDPVAEIARKQFGVDYLFPLQRMAIANILDAIDEIGTMRQLVLFPTGFGKSLCFQLPALLGPGPTVVIYPLLALMADQKNSLERRGIPCALFRGGLSDVEWNAQCDAVRSGAAKIIITNPESLATTRLSEFISRQKVFHVAIDEAHCVSEWGETFRPSYLRLKECIAALQPRAVSAFTATASPPVACAIAGHIFGSNEYLLVSTDIDKPNIVYSVEPTMEPLHTLVRLVREKQKPLIVFDQSRDGVRRLCELLHERTSFDARFYHAGLSKEEKDDIEAWFMKSDDGILVATCAYGLGVDKRNIRTVIHFREPPSVEAYIQESGRGGRDGNRAEAVLIHDANEADKEGPDGRAPPKLENADAGPGPNGTACSHEEVRKERQMAFLRYGASETCRREFLLALMGSDLASPCSGCDVCNKSARFQPEGLAEVVEFFRVNRRRFPFHQSARLLCQKKPAQGAVSLEQPPTCAGAGLLSDWDEHDVRILLHGALRKGIVTEKKTFPWKGKIELDKKAK